MMKRSALPVTLCMMILLQVGASAQEAQQSSMEQLSKEIANPLAQIWNLSFQFNHTRLQGEILAGHEYVNTGLFQPILPVPLGETYTAFARPVVTVVGAPTRGEYVGGPPSHPVLHGIDHETKLGDLILPVGVGLAKTLGWSWGGGLTFIFPTSQHALAASHKYQAGPTALALWANENWMAGGHVQHWWDIGNDGASDDDPVVEAKHAADLNHTDLQYFIIRHLPNAWQLRASPHVTADWEQDSGNRWTVPVALGAGKMIKLGPMPVMFMGEIQYSLVSPDEVGRDLTYMLQVNFVIKNPFGTL